MTADQPRADVFLLCAGFGKRLRPLTENTPKPLLCIGGKTLVEHNLELIARSGFRRVIINLHYLGDQIRRFVADGSKWGLDVQFVEEPVILDTGGAIRNIETLLQQDYLLTINSDILISPDFSLADVLKAHTGDPRRPAATLVLRPDADADVYGPVAIDEQGRVVSFLGVQYVPAPAAVKLMFLGVAVYSRQIFDYMPGAGEVFSITRDTMKKVLSNGGVIASYVYGGFWRDIGTPERFQAASKEWEKSFGVPRSGRHGYSCTE